MFDMENVSMIFNSLANDLGKYLPITVIAAIALFIIKEIVDFIKKHKAKKNKIKAISHVISEEIKFNHWSLKKLFEAYKTLADLFEKHPKAIYRVKETRFGSVRFECKEEPSEPVWSGQTLPRFVSDQFNHLLPSLAELDFKTAKRLQITYEEIAELEHYRQTLIMFVSGESHEENVFVEMTKHFISDFAQEENDYFKQIEDGYKALIGKPLKEFRLR